MRLEERTLAGLCFFVGSAQFLTAMMIGEAVLPGYNAGADYISDLGVGTTALLFNASVVLLGLLSLFAVYILHRAQRSQLFAVLAALSGLGTVGVGLFPETTGAPHVIFAGIAFLFGGLAALASYRIQDAPMRYVSALLGILVLAALVLYRSDSFLGLGPGGMERMIVYPVLLWEAGFGAYLMRPAVPPAAASAGQV